MAGHPAVTRRPRVVSFGGQLPHSAISNAGGIYVRAIHEALRDGADVTFVVPDTEVNLDARTKEGAPAAAFVGARTAGTRWGRLAWRLGGKADRLARLAVPGIPSGPWLVWLSTPAARSLVKQADVIDLQWADFVALAPALRRMNPGVRMVGTFHDVMAQLYRRRAAAARGANRWRWQIAAWLASALDRRVARALDVVITLSPKDRHLLAAEGVRDVLVIDPPLASATPVERTVDPVHPRIVFVGYFAREMNREAAVWFLTEVWPQVQASVPGVVLALAGADPDGLMKTLVGKRADVEVTGFVDDLAPIYARASVAVVPLQMGSGIKFKTVEAILAAVPTVATSIGAEGIDPSLLAAIADDPQAFVSAVVNVLREPIRAEEAARNAAKLGRERYSVEGFHQQARATYGL